MSAAADRLAGLSPEKRALLAKRLAEQAALPTVVPAAAPKFERIAIVAAACRLPGGVRSPDEFWQLLLQGRDAVGAVPPERWDGDALFDADPALPRRINSRSGGFLDGVAEFDAAFFGISPREAALMDPQQRLLLEVAWEALESAGLVINRLAGSASGVFVGAHSHSNDYQLLQLAQPGGVESHSSTGSAHSILANRLSYVFDWRGPSMALDTACSSSLVAVHLASQSLRSGECDLALAGGVNLMLLPSASLMFSKLQILSSDGMCRTFDAAASGIARGEGCGLVVLKRLSDALRDGDPVLATIAGSAVNQDGASNGLTAPNGPAQEAVIRRALAQAGMVPQRVGLVETHGTGTPMGDPVEVEALAQVFGPAQGADHRCYLGAVKTNLGHLEAAAGIAGLIKAVWCLRHRQIPANLHFTQINPHIRLEGTPFVIPTAPVPWPATQALRVAGVSSFGFGGTNAHVVLEEHAVAPAEGGAAPTARAELYAVSAKSAAALAQAARDHAAALRALPNDALADAIHTATARRSHHGHRLAVVGATATELAGRLDARLADGLPAASHNAAAQTVFVYTGQGSQWAGMGRELFDTEPVFRAKLLEVTTAFQQQAGWDLLGAITEPSTAAALAATEVAQPAIFAMQVALTAWFRARGLLPGAVLGHSVGEIAAAHAAGVLSLDDAVRVVLQRSRAMQPALGQGRMVQAACSPQDLRDELALCGGTLSIAALNSPRSTVLSGPAEALAQCVSQLEARGIATRALGVEYAFHSAQMERFVPAIVQSLRGLKPQPAALPLMSSVSGRWSEDCDFDAAYWGRNVRETVRFAPALRELIDAGFRLFLEVGPHPALGAGIHEVAEAAGAPATVAASLRRAQPARAALLAGLGALYEGGAAISWPARAETARRVVPLPTYPWQRQRHWLDAPDAAALAFNVTGRTVEPARDDDNATGCYQMEWRAAPIGPAAAAPLAIDLDALVEPLAAWAASQPESQALGQESEVLFGLEQRATAYAWGALIALGVKPRAGEFLASDAGASLGVITRHARLWQRLLHMLETSGHVQASGDSWVVTPAGERACEADAPAPSARVEAALLDRCGAALAAVLRGQADPLTLLFPPEGRDSAADVYTATASARTYNRLAAEAIASVVRGNGGRALRVLEIGAGTGATTAAVMPQLPAGSSYCYTDVSPAFLHDAQARFQGSALALNFRRLDIEQAPAAQGFASGSFDIVVACNVLHASADLRRSVQHVRGLLAPGGLLVLVESVARRAWLDLTFGLTDGWWRFDDAPLRADGALVSAPQWTALLAEAGFESARAVGDALSRNSLHAQALLLARAPAAAPAASAARRFEGTAWLVVCDRGGVGLRLADAIRAEGGDCECVDNAAPTGVLPGPRRGIVHCGALDAPAADATGLAELDAAVNAGVASALAWAQWLTGSTANQGARLWLITRGAQRVAAADRSIAPSQALQWGLGRSLALEASQAWGGLIDLDPNASADAAVAALLDELCTSGDEDQIALRTSGRHVARLARQPRPRAVPLALNPNGVFVVTGGLGGLGPKIARWLAAQGARHIVLLGRSGVPDAEATDAIQSLRSQGTEVSVERADVADRDAMARLFERLRDNGTPVRGVVHAAAVIAFQSLAQLSAAELAAALRAKVQGSWVLHELTRDTPLDLFVLFSSGTTVFGAKGLAAYAAANQFLGALAWQRAALGLPATCVDWGAWSEIRLLGAAAHKGVEQLGFRAMSDAQAFDMLAGLVHDRVPQCMVADIDWSVAVPAYQAHGSRPFLEQFVADALAPPIVAKVSADTAAQPPADAAQPDLRTTLGPLSPRARRDHLAGIVREELARVLGLPGPQAIDATKGFFELGLDSLMAMQLRRRLAGRVGVELPATITFNYPTVADLSDHLLGIVAPAEPVAPVAGTDKLEALSDAQVRSLLMAELEGWSDAPAAQGAHP